jgi:hypothetical protein
MMTQEIYTRTYERKQVKSMSRKYEAGRKSPDAVPSSLIICVSALSNRRRVFFFLRYLERKSNPTGFA